MAYSIDLLLLTLCATMVATIAHPELDDQHVPDVVQNVFEKQAEVHIPQDVDPKTTTETALRLPTSEEQEQAWVNYKQLYSK